MLLKRSSRSSINTSRLKARKFKTTFQSLGPFLKIIPAILVLLLVIVVGKQALTIHKIKCTVNDRVCPREIEGVLYHLADTNYFIVNKKELTWAIEQLFPVDSLELNFSYPNTLVVRLSGVQEAYPLQVYQVQELPNLSLDIFATSTESAEWRRPVSEIRQFGESLEGSPQKIWENGTLTPDISTGSGQVKLFYTKIPSEDHLTKMYRIITLALRYLENPQIYILNDRLFLSQENLPDIIVYADSTLSNVEMSLQSLDYLVTIKKDARVLNLSFKHPIIK